MSTDPNLPPDNTPLSNQAPLNPVPGALPPQTTDSGLAPNVAAGLAVLFSIISGIVFFIIEKRNQFVRFWAMQAIFFGAAALVFTILSTVIVSILGHISGILVFLWFLVSLVVNLGFLVVWIIMLVKAFSGNEWEVPYLGKLARQQLNKPPMV